MTTQNNLDTQDVSNTVSQDIPQVVDAISTPSSDIYAKSPDDWTLWEFWTHLWNVYFDRIDTQRVSGGEFFMSSTPFSIITVIIGILIYMFSMINIYIGSILQLILGIGTLIISIYFGIKLLIKRSHDLGQKGTYAWRLLIPFYNLYIIYKLLIGNSQEKNEYGDNPLFRQPKSDSKYWITFFLSLVLSIGSSFITFFLSLVLSVGGSFVTGGSTDQALDMIYNKNMPSVSEFKDANLGNDEGQTYTGEVYTGQIYSGKVFGVADCDQYIGVMNCLLEKIPENGHDAYLQTLDEVVQTWKKLDQKQLAEACKTTMDALRSQKETFESAGCPLK